MTARTIAGATPSARTRLPDPARAATGYNRGVDLRSFPGGDLVEQGLADLAHGIESAEALLVSIGGDRLRRAGVAVPEGVLAAPERRLYDQLAATGPDGAHSRYNALIRRLVRFEHAVECAHRST